jgi:hypothetical protein
VWKRCPGGIRASPATTNSHKPAYANTTKHFHTAADVYGDQQTDTHQDVDAHERGDRHGYSNGNDHRHADEHPDAPEYVDRYEDADSNEHADEYAHSDRNENAAGDASVRDGCPYCQRRHG